MNEVRNTLSGQAGLLCELLTAAMEPSLARSGLSLGTFELLSSIHASGNRATQIEIARRLGITPPSLSESVRSAVSRGLVEQHADSDDARRKILKLTPQGKKAMSAIVKGVNNAELEMIKGISEEQIYSAIETLTRVNRNLARMVERDGTTSGSRSRKSP